MTKYDAHDKFFYPNTKIPKNILNIEDSELLNEIEKESLDRVYENCLGQFPDRFDAKYVNNIHIEIFGKLYDWAGKYRNVDMVKDNTHFANCRFIAELMEEWETLLNNIDENCLERDNLADKLAQISIEFNAIHPYREGNGRAIRFLLDQIAVQCDYLPIWSNVLFNKAFKKEYIDASAIGVLKQDYSPMKDIILRNLKK